MAERNPYAMDPNIAAGFSSLSRALLGSAQDDASIAQANLANTRGELVSAQTETENALRDHRANEILSTIMLRDAQAKTSGQQGLLYGAQAGGQNIKNRGMEGRLGAFEALSSDPAMMNRVSEMLGVEGVDASSLVRSLFDLDSNSEQMQSALANIGVGADRQTARTIQLNPKSSNSDILTAMAIADPTTYASMMNNTADNRQSGLNNAADNRRSFLNNEADNRQSGGGSEDSDVNSSAVGTNIEYDRFTKSFENAVTNFGTETIMTMPDSALAWLQRASLEMLNSDMADGMEFQEAFDENVLKIVRGGVIKANIEGTGGLLSSDDTVSFPKYIFDFHLKDKNNKKLSETIDEMEYSEDEKVAILKAYLAALPD